MWSEIRVNVRRIFVISIGLRKIATILLLVILLFSLFGYRLLISSLLEKADRDLEVQLNENSYDESQLVAFKVPVTRLSYYNPSDQWERIEGSIEIGNTYYKYVKRRIVDDSLEVLCIPNPKARKLQEMNRQHSHPTAGKVPAPEPYVFVALCVVEPSPCKQLSTFYHYTVSIPSPSRMTEERPPSYPA